MRRLIVSGIISAFLSGFYTTLHAQPVSLESRKAPEVTQACRAELVKGEELLKKDDKSSYESAGKVFQKAIDAQYDCVPALIGYAQAITLGRGFDLTFEEYTVAYEYITRALVLDPLNSRGYWVMADLVRHTNRPELAVRLVDRSLTLNENDPWGHYVLGSAIIGVNPAVAIDEFERALKLRPEWHRVRFNLAAAYITDGQFKKAEGQLKLYLEIRPDDVMALTNMGIVYFQMGDISQAETFFRKALELSPNFPPALKGLGDTAMTEKDYAGAAASYQKIIDANPRDPLVLSLLGRAQEEMGEVAKARESYRRALELNPGDAETRKRLDDLNSQKPK